MDIFESTQKYETWVRNQIQVNEKDFDTKHKRMAENLFPFFRATYYRWDEHWKDLCPQLARGLLTISTKPARWHTRLTWSAW